MKSSGQVNGPFFSLCLSASKVTHYINTLFQISQSIFDVKVYFSFFAWLFKSVVFGIWYS